MSLPLVYLPSICPLHFGLYRVPCANLISPPSAGWRSSRWTSGMRSGRAGMGLGPPACFWESFPVSWTSRSTSRSAIFVFRMSILKIPLASHHPHPDWKLPQGTVRGILGVSCFSSFLDLEDTPRLLRTLMSARFSLHCQAGMLQSPHRTCGAVEGQAGPTESSQRPCPGAMKCKGGFHQERLARKLRGFWTFYLHNSFLGTGKVTQKCLL